MNNAEFKSGDPAIHKGQKCIVVAQVANVVTIRLPNGDDDHVCVTKLKKPEEF